MTESLSRELLPGEAILWTGRPLPGGALRPVEALLIPFSLLWAGFAVFWNVGVWRSGAPLPFRLWGLPFLAVGAYIAVGRFAVDAWLRQGLAYAVTDRRVLVVRDRPVRRVTSLDLRRLPAIELSEAADGSGTIRFGISGGWSNRRGFGSWHPSLDAVPQFLRIPDARSVHDLIQGRAGG